MRVNKLVIYKDGGTIKVDTDEGVFYIDRRRCAPWNFNGYPHQYIDTIGDVFDDYPKTGNLVPNGNEIKRKIYDALEGYEDGFYKENHVEGIRTFIKPKQIR